MGGLNILHVSSDATNTNPSVVEGTIGYKDSGGLKLPVDMKPTPPHGVAHTSQTDSKDQADKSQSAGLEGSGSDQNQGKSSYEEDPANPFLQIDSMASF